MKSWFLVKSLGILRLLRKKILFLLLYFPLHIFLWISNSQGPKFSWWRVLFDSQMSNFFWYPNSLLNFTLLYLLWVVGRLEEIFLSKFNLHIPKKIYSNCINWMVTESYVDVLDVRVYGWMRKKRKADKGWTDPKKRLDVFYDCLLTPLLIGAWKCNNIKFDEETMFVSQVFPFSSFPSNSK